MLENFKEPANASWRRRKICEEREVFLVMAKQEVRGESDNKGFVDIQRLGAAVVFGFCDRHGVEKVESQRVAFQFGFVEKSGSERGPFFLADLAFEDGLLHSDAVVGAGPGNAAEPTRATIIGSCNVVGNENEHGATLG